MQAFFLGLFGLIALAVFGAYMTVTYKLRSIDGVRALWWESDTTCPSFIAVCSCIWNLQLLRQTAYLLTAKSHASAEDSSYEAERLLLDVEFDCRLIQRELLASILRRHQRHSAVRHFLALFEHVESYRAA